MTDAQVQAIDTSRLLMARIVRRWPAWLALALTAPTFDGGERLTIVVEGYGEALFLLPLPYLVGAHLQRRDATRPGPCSSSASQPSSS